MSHPLLPPAPAPAPWPTDRICCLKAPILPPDGVVAPGPATPDLTLGSWKLVSDRGKRWPCDDSRKKEADGVHMRR